jgi:hypothetical protein
MLRFIAFIIMVGALLCYSAQGQSTAQLSGVVKGTVTDQSRARVAGAKIYLRSKTGQQTFIADDAGEYLLNLADGKYKLWTHRDGFRPSSVKEIRIIGKQVY